MRPKGRQGRDLRQGPDQQRDGQGECWGGKGGGGGGEGDEGLGPGRIMTARGMRWEGVKEEAVVMQDNIDATNAQLAADIYCA